MDFGEVIVFSPGQIFKLVNKTMEPHEFRYLREILRIASGGKPYTPYPQPVSWNPFRKGLNNRMPPNEHPLEISSAEIGYPMISREKIEELIEKAELMDDDIDFWCLLINILNHLIPFTSKYAY